MAARQAGINIIAVGIGSLINVAELKRIASEPASANVFLADNVTLLTDTIQGQISTALCNNINNCASNPCQNGATCSDLMNGYTCSPCPDGSFTGFSCERHCSGVLDITFVLQSSGTLGYARWHYVTDFVTDVVSQLDIGRERTRVAVVYYSDSASLAFTLDQYYARQDLMQAVMMIPYVGGRTNTASALDLLLSGVYQSSVGDRSWARNIAVLVSNGPSTIDAESVASEAEACRNAAIKLIAISVDPSASDELEAIASLPLERNILNASSISTLGSLTTGVVAALCNDVNECASNPCQNGGSCVDDYGRYFCRCPATFTGNNCQMRCNTSLDVIFVLDISTSVQDKYELGIDFAVEVVDGLDVDSGRVRVGAVAFADQVLGQFFMSDHVGDRDGVVDNLRFFNPGGSTNGLAAFDAVQNDQLTAAHGSRVGSVPTVIIFVSDGAFIVNVNETFAAADRLKSNPNNDLMILSVAVGSFPTLESMQRIASSANAVLPVPTQDDVETAAGQLVEELCSGIV
jgi:collagen type VI alpha